MKSAPSESVVIGGLGVIGIATRHTFKIKDYIDLKGSNIAMEEVARNKKYIFICLPTPAHNSLHDVSNIESVIANILSLGGEDKIFVVRSTTSPGQLEKLSKKLQIKNIVHYPEFLTMSTWKKDSDNPDIVVLGFINKKVGSDVMNLLKDRFGEKPKYISTDLATSELIKCSINNFYALKVIFANEIYDFSSKVGADYTKVKEAMYNRKWIGANHLDIFFRGARGVRGPCLPKELEAMVKASKSRLLKVAKEINDKLVIG